MSREDETEQSPESDASLPVDDGDAVVQGDGHHQHDGTPTAANRSSRFPTTRRSWITRTIARGPEGEQEVARFVMSAYLVPLTAYARSTPGLGDLDPEDLVHDFLLHKVSAPGYFPYWATTNRPLRRWLVSGFHFRLKDRRRQASTERTRTETAAPEIGIEFDEDRFADFERTWARDLVRRAVEQTAEYCRTRQLDEHWTVFQRHHLDGLSFRDLVDAHGLPARRLARMSRTAADRLRMIIQELLARDGVDPDDIAAEITRLLELVR